ncbi:Elongation of very long chain fatty acids protein 7 [Durusdinium trenchii]|uniref:Elongation of very long chain fatty acids protein 7 n=1 Tax=Durusdinium trenchii TaxID=1381693 RepID=A0ABP0IKA3_9DINO
MWGWFFACRYACGGDTYFPASVNSATRAVVYAFYSWSLLTECGVPLVQKAHITELQMFQFAICACHALSCMYNFWNMQIPKMVLVIYFVVMMNGLVLYTDFHHQVEGSMTVYQYHFWNLA